MWSPSLGLRARLLLLLPAPMTVASGGYGAIRIRQDGQGTGLGLAICRDIVQGHGGRIEVESQVGTGTTIRVWLPAPQEAER